VSDAPKSAYEIAMEKLRAQDRERGEAPGKKLTPKQKARITEIRQFYEAKLAEREILYRSELARSLEDPEKVRQVEEGYRIDRRRLESERDGKIEKIKG
jgi:hypothetical protein